MPRGDASLEAENRVFFDPVRGLFLTLVNLSGAEFFFVDLDTMLGTGKISSRGQDGICVSCDPVLLYTRPCPVHLRQALHGKGVSELGRFVVPLGSLREVRDRA